MNKKPLIVQIAAYYPPHLGGLERVAEEISQQLAADGYQVTVLASDFGSKHLPKVETQGNLTVKRLRSFEFAHTPFAPAFLWELLRLPKDTIVHLHLSQVYWADLVFIAHKLCGFKYVVHYHLDVEKSGKLGFIFEWWKKWIQPFIIKGAAKVITLSPEQSEIMYKRYKMPAEKVSFMPNGVGESFFSEVRQSMHDPLRLLYVGRLDVQKSPARLVHMMTHLKVPAELTFVGDGELRKELEDLVHTLGLKNVIFAGKKYGNDLIEAYKKSDMLVISSDREGMPLVVLEAMASGLPIIGSNVLGITELVQNVGVLIDEPYAENFAKAITEIAQDNNLYKKLSEQSFETARAHTWTKLVKQLEMLYNELSL